jgi:hypothetical protein
MGVYPADTKGVDIGFVTTHAPLLCFALRKRCD